MKLLKQFFLISFLTILCAASLACSAPAANTAADPADASGSPGGADTIAADASHRASQAQSAPVEITDFLGDTSVVEGSDRIISLSSSATQVLLELNASDRIVGLDSYSETYLPGTEIVGDYTGPDLEKIAALEPDIVFAANKIQRDAIDQMRALGITVIAAEPTQWDQIPESFQMIGAAVGNESGAEALSNQLNETVRDVQDSAPAEPVTCYYVLSYGNAGNWTSGEGSFINTMMEYAGGAPTTKGKSPSWLEYPMEDLVADDPQCIILSSDAGTIEDFMSTPGYETLSAVRSGLVFEVDADLVDQPGPLLNTGLRDISFILQEAAEQRRMSDGV